MALVLTRVRRHSPDERIVCHSARLLRDQWGKAALLAPHHTGWHLHRLAPPGPDLTLNGVDPDPTAPLGVGDVIRVGRIDLVVDEADADGPTFEPGDTGTCCQVDTGEAQVLVRPGQRLLIGTAGHCGLRPAAGDDLIALLVNWDRRWLLYDLTRTVSDGGPIWTAVRDGDEVTVGGVRLLFEVLAEYELVGPPADTSEAVGMVDTQHDSAAEPAGLPVVAYTADGYARLLCGWLQAHRTGVPGPPPALDPAADGAAGLGWVGPALAADPRDPAALRELARWVRDRGMDDLYRIALRRLVHADPADRPAAVSLVRAYLAAGRDPAAPARDRLQRLDEAGRFLDALVAARPTDPELSGLRLEVDAERTLARLGTLTAEAV